MFQGNSITVRSQLRHSKLGFLPGRRTKPTVSDDYIVGLTDGEGCFYVLVRPPFSKIGGARVELKFFIKVQAQDKELLDKVCNTLGCGAVYFQHETRANHAQCYRYTVSSHRDIKSSIIPFFQAHPLQSASKQRNFLIFCRIAEMVNKGLHHLPAGVQQIQKLKSQMNRGARVAR